MSGLNNLKPDRVIKAFERAGWKKRGQAGSHVHLTKEVDILDKALNEKPTIQKLYNLERKG